MEEKIEKIVSKKLAYCPEVKESDIYRVHRFRVEELKAELSTLIQEERKEAFGEGYLDALKWCKTMGIKDSVIPEKIKVIKQYLSSIGKDEE
jgi:hypothetical protein